MDAAFGSKRVCNALTEKGYLYTIGANKQTATPWLWPYMAHDLCNGEGRVLKNKDGIFASLFCDNDQHTVYTNSWKATADAITSSDSDDDSEGMKCCLELC